MIVVMSRTRQLNGNSRKKTALCCYQLYERLIEPFNQKVDEEFGHQEI